jgi:DNA-binding LacI/PurR family transcriptional regulator
MLKAMTKVSMKDVAKAAGVSQPTVSYAYNRPSKISAAQRQHILKVAAKIGYPGPNALGRSLRSGKVGAIGLIMMDKLSLAFDDPSTVALLKGIGQSGEFENLALTLFPLKHQGLLPAQGHVSNSLAVRGLVDGLIMTTLPDDHPIITQVLERKIPFVIVDSPKLDGAHFIGIDDYGAAQLQLRHLLELGHRKIGILADRLNPDSYSGFVSRERLEQSAEAVVRERLRGYVDAAADIGVEYRNLHIYEAGGLGATAGQAAAFKLLTSRKVTAVVATSDVMALACLKAAADLDLEVPRQLSVVGFDDIPEAVHAGLTTIRQPMVEKGIVAAQFISEILNDGPAAREPKLKLFPTRLVVRTSTMAI